MKKWTEKDLIQHWGFVRCKAAVTAGRAYLHRTKTMFTREEVFMISGLEAHHIAVESLDQALKDHATTGRKRPSTTGPDVGSGIPQLLAKGLISLRDEARARKIRTIPSKDKLLKDLTVGDLDELIRELRLMACRPIDLSEQALDSCKAYMKATGENR